MSRLRPALPVDEHLEQLEQLEELVGEGRMIDAAHRDPRRRDAYAPSTPH
jgi:hypothetical protein